LREPRVFARCGSLLRASTSAVSAIVDRESSSSRASPTGAAAARQCQRNDRANATSDMGADRAFRTAAVAQPSAGRERRAAADEAQALRLAAAGAHEPPVAQSLPAEAGEPHAGREEARAAPRGHAPQREPDEAWLALAQGHESPAAVEPQHAELRPAVAPRHSASAPD